MIAFLKGKINEVSYYPNRYVRMRLSQNENYLSKSNVILRERSEESRVYQLVYSRSFTAFRMTK